MSDTHFLILLAVAILIAGLQLIVLLRKPRIELPPELLAQLQRLEQQGQATRMEVAKNDGALDGMANQLQGFTQATSRSLEAVRQTVDEKLAQAVNESRTGRTELLAAFAAFEAQLAQRLAALDAAQSLALSSFRTELTGTLGTMSGALQRPARRQRQPDPQPVHGVAGSDVAADRSLVQGTQQNAEQLRTVLNERLTAIQADNTAKLEEMRRTVDEKLHATLEQRLGESFKLVSDRLEQVHKGLGEMQTLAGSVGDLKRVMTNVKSRGTWGEVQLGAIIDNVLTPDQYAKNVKTVPGSDELVEFAIRLPGKHDEHPVWLPIDSKYPVEHYQRLMDAQDTADKGAIASAGNAFEASIRFEAKKIFSKYVSPPHTTDFAILYLPTEGLFAETLRRPGLLEALQNDCRVMVTGPANLAAMLNSLQMGFKTLAIERRSSEVWSLLGQVKNEFAKFGDVVEATKKSIDAAARKFDEVGTRTRAIQRKLRDVQDLPAPAADDLPALPLQPLMDDE